MIRLKQILIIILTAQSICAMDAVRQQEKKTDDAFFEAIIKDPVDMDCITELVRDRVQHRWLCVAALLGQSDICKLLLEAKAPVDVQMGPNAPLTGLMCAALHGSCDLAQLFIDNGADIDFACCGTTPLIAASLALHKPLVTFFMERAFFIPPPPEKVTSPAETEIQTAAHSPQTVKTVKTQRTSLIDVLGILKQLQDKYPGLSAELVRLIFEHSLREDEALHAQACEKVFDIVRCKRNCVYPAFLIPMVAEKMVPFTLTMLQAIRDKAHEHFSNEYILVMLIHHPQREREDWAQPSDDTVRSMFDLTTINQQILRNNIASRLSFLRGKST